MNNSHSAYPQVPPVQASKLVHPGMQPREEGDMKNRYPEVPAVSPQPTQYPSHNEQSQSEAPTSIASYPNIPSVYPPGKGVYPHIPAQEQATPVASYPVLPHVHAVLSTMDHDQGSVQVNQMTYPDVRSHPATRLPNQTPGAQIYHPHPPAPPTYPSVPGIGGTAHSVTSPSDAHMHVVNVPTNTTNVTGTGGGGGARLGAHEMAVDAAEPLDFDAIIKAVDAKQSAIGKVLAGETERQIELRQRLAEEKIIRDQDREKRHLERTREMERQRQERTAERRAARATRTLERAKRRVERALSVSSDRSSCSSAGGGGGEDTWGGGREGTGGH